MSSTVPDVPTAVSWAIANGFEPGQSLAWYREAGGDCGALAWHLAWLAEQERRADAPAPDQLELDL